MPKVKQKKSGKIISRIQKSVNIFFVILLVLNFLVVFNIVEYTSITGSAVHDDRSMYEQIDICNPIILYFDADGDGHGGTNFIEDSCEGEEIPYGYTTGSGDCDDTDPSVWQNLTVYEDRDRDGFTTNESKIACTNNLAPKGYLIHKSPILDCNDRSSLYSPNSKWQEISGGPDYNCNGEQDLAVGTIIATKKQYKGDLGGPSGADIKCGSIASLNEAKLAGIWVAFLSTSEQNAVDKLPNTKYVDGFQQLIAGNKTDLFKGWIEREIKFSESGSKVYEYVWTGSDENGKYVYENTCNDWTSDEPSDKGIVGSTKAANSDWISQDNSYCNRPRSLFCVRIA